jgi:hypothetical protein
MLLEQFLRIALARLNLSVPPVALDEAFASWQPRTCHRCSTIVPFMGCWSTL